MPCQISVTDEDVRYLTQQAQEELVSLGEAYARELLREASRLEAARRTHQGEPEITRTMLKDAALLLKRYPPKSKRSWGFAVIQILSSVAILIAGGLFDLDKLQQDTNWLFIFLVVLSTAITLTVVEIVLGRTQ